jgi:hypothetical protein
LVSSTSWLKMLIIFSKFSSIKYGKLHVTVVDW